LRDKNANARKKIVEALGRVCETIPIIKPKPTTFVTEFTVDDMEGHPMVQYEDDAGRKGCLIKLKNKETEEVGLVNIYQVYRETWLARGDEFMMKGVLELEGVDKIVSFLHQVVPHPKFEFVQ
jgi:hypothetical protein